MLQASIHTRNMEKVRGSLILQRSPANCASDALSLFYNSVLFSEKTIDHRAMNMVDKSHRETF